MDDEISSITGGSTVDPFALTDYIESSGTQYIDTGYVANDNTEIEMILDLTPAINIPGDYILFGSRLAGDYNRDIRTSLPFYCGFENEINNLIPNLISTIYCCAANRINEANNNWYIFGKNATYYSVRNHKIRIRMSNSLFELFTNAKDKITVNKTPDVSLSSNHATIGIFLMKNSISFDNASCVQYKLYAFRIKEGNTLVHEFIPWTDQNDVVCLKDTITGNLKYNQGTGVFVRGTDS